MKIYVVVATEYDKTGNFTFCLVAFCSRKKAEKEIKSLREIEKNNQGDTNPVQFHIESIELDGIESWSFNDYQFGV